MFNVIFRVNNRIIPTSHLDSPKVWQSDPSWCWSYICFLGVELMNRRSNQVRMQRKKTFSVHVCVCVWISSPWKWKLVHSCVSVCVTVYAHVVKQGGKTASLFLGMGQAQRLREYPGWSVAFQWKGAISLSSRLSESHVPLQTYFFPQRPPALNLSLPFFPPSISAPVVFPWKSH